MTLFFILAALLVLLCLGWLLYGLFQFGSSETDQEAVNITLARERRETLNAALANGSIDQSTYDYEREQLDHDLAADLMLDKNQQVKRQGHVPAAILVAVFIPISAGALYLHLGDPAAITQDYTTQGSNPSQSPDLADMLPQLEKRLADKPDDIEGWRLLGRSYLSVGEFPRAKAALEKALALDENDVPTLAQLAEAIAMTQNGELKGEPFDYLQRAQALDADNEHAMWLLSIAHQQAGDHDTALEGFNRLTQMAQENPEALATIEQMRAVSIEALRSPAEPTTTDGNTDTDNSAAITVVVSINDTAMNNVSPDQSVFIYAKASNGPPMPLAVSRMTVQDLPVSVVLDDSMAMLPNMTLSAFASVTVGARVSATGNAIAQSGDWFTEQEGVKPTDNANVDLIIDQQTP